MLLLNALVLSGLVGAGSGWTNLLLSNQLQCKTPYAMTVGVPQGEKEVVVRVESEGRVVAEKKLEAYRAAEAMVFDLDDSGCEEALLDLTNAAGRLTVFVSIPKKGKPALQTFGPADLSASKAKRIGSKLRVYESKKGKLCIADFDVRNDALVKAFEDCY